jgi:hypothetical protein
VAAYRYGLGEVVVRLVPIDDRGTRKGAEAAAERLVDEGVAGIVVATEGPQVAATVDAATEADVPVLLPYEDQVGDLPDGAWTTGPADDRTGEVLAEAMTAAGLDRPALVDAGGGQPPGVLAVTGERIRPGADADRVARALARRAKAKQAPDAVVVSGPAEQQARVVRSLQGSDLQLPVYLTPDALSPAFGRELAAEGGSLQAPLTTAGLGNDDVAALESGEAGAAMSAFLAGVRAAAEDGSVRDFFDDQPFATVAGAVDARSHDAVVALVSAAAEAGSAEPAEVASALGSLQVGWGDGLAGPPLDFGDTQAVTDDAVVPLQSTRQDPGLRAAPPQEPRLFWFALPES